MEARVKEFKCQFGTDVPYIHGLSYAMVGEKTDVYSVERSWLENFQYNLADLLYPPGKLGRGRNAGHPAPPAQVPACATNALGSYLG
jgi:hypothetical protein